VKIFLAGATGVVGRPLIGMLTANGHEVVGATRDPGKAEMLRALGATPAIVNALDREALIAAVRDARPDAIVHQLTDLARFDLAATNKLRIEGTRNLVDAARAAGVRRMVTQSFGPAYAPGEGLATEETPLHLDAPEPFGTTVAALATMEATAAELPESVILRYGLFYGPGTSFDRDGFHADLVRKGQYPANESVNSFVHVEDAARAAMLALDWPAGVYNIADDDPAPVREWLPRYAAEVGGPPPPVVEGKDALMSRGFSSQKARREQGWTPRRPSWRAGFLGAVPA
jgi:nucleoside-diphosphate-sugar epimerase